MKRHAKVEMAFRCSEMSTGRPVLQIDTDYPRADERSFCIESDSPAPAPGTPIAYGDHHAWYKVGGRVVVARKVGYNFDRDRPLR